MFKSINTGETDGPLSLLAMRVATELISLIARPASFEDCSPHSAREYIVNLVQNLSP